MAIEVVPDRDPQERTLFAINGEARPYALSVLKALREALKVTVSIPLEPAAGDKSPQAERDWVAIRDGHKLRRKLEEARLRDILVAQLDLAEAIKALKTGHKDYVPLQNFEAEQIELFGERDGA